MHLLHLLLRRSRGPFVAALLAGVVSGVSGTALLALINVLLTREKGRTPAALLWAFVALCALVPLARFLSAYVLLQLSQSSVRHLRLQLVRRILGAPLSRLEDLGSHRLLATLTQDVNAIAVAFASLPMLCINGVIVVSCLVYLGWLAWPVLVGLLVFLGLGILSYQLPTSLGARRQQLARELADALHDSFRAVTGAVKELKLHRRRRSAFLAELGATSESLQERNVTSQAIFVAAASWGQMLFFIAIGLAIFLVPGLWEVNQAAVVGFTMVFLFMMAPLQVVLDTVPTVVQAEVALSKVERMGFSLNEQEVAVENEDRKEEPASWQRLELRAATYLYQGESQEDNFSLGPIDLILHPAEILFIAGGNGSGKTTLAKMITGLYPPRSGEIRLGDCTITDQNREWYRQHFTAIFADSYLFQSLLGLERTELDPQAREYLARLHLEQKVRVEGGRLSTIALSQGQRKRLALLTAYLEDRPIYLFDEWAADQDPYFKEIFYSSVLPELKSRGKTVVVISHDDRYYGVADRTVKLEAGKPIG